MPVPPAVKKPVKAAKASSAKLSLSWEIPIIPYHEPLCWVMVMRYPVAAYAAVLAALTLLVLFTEGLLGIRLLWTFATLRTVCLWAVGLLFLGGVLLYEAGEAQVVYTANQSGVRSQVWLAPRHAWGRVLVRLLWGKTKRRGTKATSHRYAWKSASRVFVRPESMVVLLCKPYWYPRSVLFCTHAVYKTLCTFIRERFIPDDAEETGISHQQ